MKTGKVIKCADISVSENDLSLINKYTRRELTSEDVYVFSVVLCDNDIDRDFERFTVESLFELEKLFVGKTGIFDHNPSATNQTARIFSCKVEHIEGKKTATGDDYFRLVARAYIPKSEGNSDIILSLDSGIIKEVSVGCAVKSTLCSICSNDISSTMCHHVKGKEYHKKLCYGELDGVIDAYEFSFVAVPAQKNAGVIKAFSENKRENKKMKDILVAIKKGEDVTLKSHQSKSLCEYIAQLEEKAKDGELYKENLRKSVIRLMGVSQPNISTDTLQSIIEKLTVDELSTLKEAYKKSATQFEKFAPQLGVSESSKDAVTKSDKNNQFTI